MERPGVWKFVSFMTTRKITLAVVPCLVGYQRVQFGSGHWQALPMFLQIETSRANHSNSTVSSSSFQAKRWWKCLKHQQNSGLVRKSSLGPLFILSCWDRTEWENLPTLPSISNQVLFLVRGCLCNAKGTCFSSLVNVILSTCWENYSGQWLFP